MQTASSTLLWFRPISPLKYALPEALAQNSYSKTVHIPMDVLTPCAASADDINALNDCDAWVLSSPTAAHLAADFAIGLGTPKVLAVMGEPSRQAWLLAGGAQPEQWFVSPTGESMGLLAALLSSRRIAVLRGKTGRNDLIESLVHASLPVKTVAMYEKKQHPDFVNVLNQAFNVHPSLMLYFSSTDQPARALEAASDTAALLQSEVWVSHERILKAAQGLGFECVKVLAL